LCGSISLNPHEEELEEGIKADSGLIYSSANSNSETALRINNGELGIKRGSEKHPF
jgi:hypothetical protein